MIYCKLLAHITIPRAEYFIKSWDNDDADQNTYYSFRLNCKYGTINLFYSSCQMITCITTHHKLGLDNNKNITHQQVYMTW